MVKNFNIKKRTVISSEKLYFDDLHILKSLCGGHDENLKIIEKSYNVTIFIKGNEIIITGDNSSVSKAKQLLQDLYFLIESGHALTINDIECAIRMLSQKSRTTPKDVMLDTILVSSKRRSITPKSFAQKQYVDAIRESDMVIGIGPAGTGKTYLAMAMAIASLTKKEVDRIILTRPAVEAGEKLGFLPGDLYEKVNPYLRPLYDALHDMMDMEKVSHLLHQGTIEVAPLGFMRGRTFNESFVILDEAQNTTSEQMKMFLTRLGFNSKVIITGDVTQVDLPSGKVSGLIEAQSVLCGIPGIRFVFFTEKDVIRHPLVQKIIKAYEAYTKKEVTHSEK